jgi:hypothetical protein
MTLYDEVWYDEDCGPLVRLYARIGYRNPTSSDEIEISTLVSRVPGVVQPAGLSEMELTILQVTAQPTSLSEIAAHVGLPIGPVRILLRSLCSAGLVTVRKPAHGGARVLEQLLAGLRTL